LRDHNTVVSSSLCGIDIKQLQRHRVLTAVSSFWRRGRGLASNIGFFWIGLTKHFVFVWKKNQKKFENE